MNTYTLDVPATMTLKPEHAGLIDDYLRGKGMVMGGVSTLQRIEDGQIISLIIETEAPLADVRTALQAYTPAKTPREQLIDQLAALYPKLRDGQATAREVQTALAGLMVIVRDLYA